MLTNASDTAPAAGGLTNAKASPANPNGARRGDEAGFPAEIDRDHHGRPRILKVDPVTGRLPTDAQGLVLRILTPYTRCSTMGGWLEDQFGLGKWRAAVALWGAFRAARDTIRIAVMAIRGYDDKADKEALYGLVDRAQQIADIDAAADHGTALHAIFEQYDKGLELPPIGADQPALDAYARAIAQVQVLASETFVVVDTIDVGGELVEVCAAGTFDRLVTVRRPVAVLSRRGKLLAVLLPGDRIIVDVKTSSTADYFGVKFRLQTFLYACGRFYDTRTGERTPTGARTDWALILHVPAGGDSATWHWVDLRGAGDLVKTALKVREHRNAGKRSIWPADLDAEVDPQLAREYMDAPGTVAPGDAGGVLGGIAAEVAVCDTRAQLVAVFRRWQDSWSPDAQRVVEARMHELGIPVRSTTRKAS